MAKTVAFASGRFRVAVDEDGGVTALDQVEGRRVESLVILNGFCYAVVRPADSEDRPENLLCIGPAGIEWRKAAPLAGRDRWYGVSVREDTILATTASRCWTILPGGLLWKGEFTK